MRRIYNKLGSTFMEGTVKLEVVRIPDGRASCSGCWYRRRRSSCYYHRHACTPALRKDGVHVVFKLVGVGQSHINHPGMGKEVAE